MMMVYFDMHAVHHLNGLTIVYSCLINQLMYTVYRKYYTCRYIRQHCLWHLHTCSCNYDSCMMTHDIMIMIPTSDGVGLWIIFIVCHGIFNDMQYVDIHTLTFM